MDGGFESRGLLRESSRLGEVLRATRALMNEVKAESAGDPEIAREVERLEKKLSVIERQAGVMLLQIAASLRWPDERRWRTKREH